MTMFETLKRGARIGGITTVLVAGAGAASAQNLTLVGGSAGGTWDALSGAMKGVLEQSGGDLSISVRPGGAISNIKAVSQDKAQLAWMLADSSNNAVAGRPPFDEPVDNLCNLAAFHPTDLHLITVESDVEGVEDFAGKHVGTLPPGTGTEATSRLVLELAGVDVDDVQMDYAAQGDLSNMMKDGHLDVWMQLSGVPGGAVADLMASNSSARILDVPDELLEKMQAENAAWGREVLPAGTYPGQDEEVRTAGYLTHFGTNCETLSEETAYEITKAIINGYQDLGTVNHTISELSVEDLARDVGVPMHPGAKRAYEEAGAL